MVQEMLEGLRSMMVQERLEGLRSTMVQKRLEGLLFLSVEREIKESMIDSFASSSSHLSSALL